MATDEQSVLRSERRWAMVVSAAVGLILAATL